MKTLGSLLLATALLALGSEPTLAQQSKPNIILIVSDDTGYGDLGPYGGGEGRGHAFDTHSVHVTVEHQGAPATLARQNTDDVDTVGAKFVRCYL